MPIGLDKIENRSRIQKQVEPEDRRSAGNNSASSQPPALATLGTELKALRLEQQITLRQVAEETHISLRHLQSLEEGQYGSLPGGMYNRAFLRSYCVYLNVDPEIYLDHYEKECSPHSERVIKPKSPSPPAPAIRIPPLFLWFLMFLFSVVGLYISRNWIAAVFSPYFSRSPASRMPAPSSGPLQTSEMRKETLPLSPSGAGDKPLSHTEDSKRASVSTQATLDEPVPGAIRLHFEVVQECWMSVTGDGKHLASKIFQPGDSQSFDANEVFVLVLGNAGGVNLAINGKPARPLGKPGEVVKLQINLQNIPDLVAKWVG